MKKQKNIITELSEVFANVLVEKPQLADDISALLGSRKQTAAAASIKEYLSKNEMRKRARAKFNSLHEKQLSKQNPSAW